MVDMEFDQFDFQHMLEVCCRCERQK